MLKIKQRKFFLIIFGLIIALISLVIDPPLTEAQIYEVPCDVQSSVGYRLGTAGALNVVSVMLASIPVILQSSVLVRVLLGTVTVNLLRFLWPLVIGANDHCTRDAMAAWMRQVEAKLGVTFTNHTLEHRRRLLDGMAGTAKKAYEWIAIIRDPQLDYQDKRTAASEYYDALGFLYRRANDARDVVVEGYSPGSSKEQTAATFLFVNDLAFLQLGLSAEMMANPFASKVVRNKTYDDYFDDAWFYFVSGHLAVERIVRCLPKESVGSTRRDLLALIKPMLDLTSKIVFKNASLQYSRPLAYRPIMSGDYVGFRLDNGNLADYEQIFKQKPPQLPLPQNDDFRKLEANLTACPKCGWDFFDKRFGVADFVAVGKNGTKNVQTVQTALTCRDKIFGIAGEHAMTLPGTPLKTCDIVSINYPLESLISAELKNNFWIQIPTFKVVGFDETTTEEAPCGQVILNHDRIKLEPAANWPGSILDAIILRAND